MQPEIGKIASVIGDSVRANILWILLDGRGLTATEIATRADLSMPNLSGHLKRLLAAELITVRTQGRHRYFQIVKSEVAELVEMMAAIAPVETNLTKAVPHPLAFCRSCYDHLAGKVGVAVTEALIASGIINQHPGGYHCTDIGNAFFAALDIDICDLQTQRRIFARPCLDWSERKDHMSGALAAAFLQATLQMGWFKRKGDTRVLLLTTIGRKQLCERLGIFVDF